jgi:hypothetical protein
MAVYREDELVAVLVIIRMFVAPLPVFRLFVSFQLGEVPMGFVLSLLPGLVGPAFVVVPGMTILMVAVVVSIVGAVLLLILRPGCPRAQSGSHPAEANPDTDAVAACISP